ncbi:MAG: DUF362 domain-containing protein [Nitrospirota bacterium]
MRLEIFKISGKQQIKDYTNKIFDSFSDLLPKTVDSKILIKPNLNANMNALTGNTTDLRLLASVIMCLKDRGYKDITIGEGTNSGYYRNKISVISRLHVDALAKAYDIKIKDLNYSESVFIPFEDGVKAGIAKDCLEADFLINMPKLKTHFEAGMSVCLKNLMGCLVGQDNKKKTHLSLANNILNINKRIKPHLHIVDGIIAMEGLGPTRGVPVNMGLIIGGADPFLIDLLCAEIAMFGYRNVTTLKAAEKLGILTKEHHDFVKSLDIERYKKKFLSPRGSLAARFIHSPKRQKYFLAIRNTRFFNYLCSTKIGGKILFKTGLRQDVFIEDEAEFKRLYLNADRCTKCNKCDEYCPVDIKLPDNLERDKDRCIECLYCFMICPERAIEFEGDLGFVNEQLRQYDSIIRKTA